MKTLTATLVCLSLGMSAVTAFAQDAPKKDAPAKDGMMTKEMTMQQCKDHMAMMQKDGMKKDDEMTMMRGAMCADMMKKVGTTGTSGTTSTDPVKK